MGSSKMLAEKLGRLLHFLLSLDVVAIDFLVKPFCICNGIRYLAMIQVRGKGDITGLSQASADSLYGVIESPPGMQDQYSLTFASGGFCHISVWPFLCYRICLLY